MRKKIIIFGAGGMLGDSFINNENILDFDVLYYDIDTSNEHVLFCDITDFKHVSEIINEQKPDIILNLAALVDLEYQENNKVESLMVNYLSAVNLFIECKKIGSTYVFISTAGIFGNQKEYYDENDKPTPLSTYGKSKYYTERFIQTDGYPKYYIFRAGWMMGGGPLLDKKFVNKIYKQIKNNNKKIFVVDDKSGAPTYTKDFSDSIIKHIKNHLPFGLYNQVGHGDCTRYEAAYEIIKLLGVDIEVEKVTSDFFNKEYFAPRPNSEKLINKKLNEFNADYMRDWKTTIKEYINEKYKI